MFEPLLVADPSFQPRWAAFQKDYKQAAEPPLYIALISLAEHVMERLGRRDTEGFDRIFAVVERWHTQGDPYVAEAASAGLLESLQGELGGNNATFKPPDGVSADDLVPWLGPETKRWWDKLFRFWDDDPEALRFDT